MRLSLFITLLNKFKKIFLREYIKNEENVAITKNTFIVEGNVNLNELEKLISINFSENNNTTLKEFLEKRIGKNEAIDNSFRFKNYLFIPQDKNFKNIMIKKQCLNGKPLFYV